MAHSQDPKYWETRWVNKATQWQLADTHPKLLKYIDLLTGKENGQSPEGLTCFVPLCGKTVDMNFMSSLGIKVIGVEFVTMACEEFFKDGNIPFTTNQVKLSNGETVTVFESTSEYKGAPVKIYNCDLYFMTSKDVKVDLIWDRGSLVAIDPATREKYGKCISGLNPKRALVAALHYDTSKKSGPPFCVEDHVLGELYGPNNVKFLESSEVPAGPDSTMEERMFLVTF